MSDAVASRQKNTRRWLPWLAALVTLALCLVLVFLLEKYLLAESRGQALQTSGQRAMLIDQQLNQGLSASYALAALVKLGDGQVADFEGVATSFLPLYPGVSALQLAPDGVIRHVVPLAGNEKSIGHNLLADEQRNKEARLAIETGRLTLAGPFELIQGGQAIIGRLPVYRDEKSFWGFSVVLIRLHDFLRAAQFDELEEQGYAYELWRTHPDSGRRHVFARSAHPLVVEPVTSALQVPNGEWFLSIAPLDGWLDVRRLAVEAIVALLLAVGGGLAVAFYLRTQRALEISEVRYRTLYEASPTMMHSIDAAGRIVSVSEEWLDTLGYQKDEVIGRSSAGFLTEESHQYAVETVLPEFYRTGSCRDIPYQMRTKDGRVLDVLLSAYGERDADGQVNRSLAVIHDVTERKQAEQRINRLLAEQRAIIENDLVGIVRVHDRRIAWANPAFEQMLGYGPGELTGVPTRQNYVDEAAYRSFGEAAYPVLAEGGVYHSLFEHVRKDGSIVWLDVSGAMLDQTSGESLWAFVDVSELKLALSRIAKSEQRMELALAGANLGLWDWHLPSGKFTCNPRMIEILGYQPGELELDNETYTGLINRSDLPAVRQMLNRHLHGEVAMFEAEYRVRHRDDHWVWVLCRGKIVNRDEHGRVVRMTGTNLDISERKQSELEIKLREARLANLISSMQDLVIVFDSSGGVIEYFYPPHGRHPHRSPASPPGGNYMERLPPDIANRFAEAIGEILVNGQPQTLEYTLQLDGEALISSATISPLREQSQFPTGFLAVVRDITSERLCQQEIEGLSRRNTLLLESVGEGIFGVDSAFRTSFANSAALSMLGFSEAEILGRNQHELFHHHRQDGRDYPGEECPVFQTMQDGVHRRSDNEWFWRKDGSGFPVSLNVTPVIENGRQTGAVVAFQDITQRRKAEEEIHQLAFFDPLTHLPNRRLLMDRLKQALAASARSGRHGALFFLDLDNFKGLNDSLGHEAGDLLLQQVARRLTECVRDIDTVARLGGDEFVLLLEALDGERPVAASQAVSVGEKILAALNQPYQIGANSCGSTPSIGIVLFQGQQVSLEELLKQADIAMYRAKAAGRNTLRLHEVAVELS